MFSKVLYILDGMGGDFPFPLCWDFYLCWLIQMSRVQELTGMAFFLSYCRLTDNLVALKEIRLEHEEGAPCTAIREGE